MGLLTTPEKQAYLQEIYYSSVEQNKSLFQIMREFSKGLFTPIISGTFLKRARTNGTELENEYSLDPKERGEIVRCLFDLYEKALKALGDGATDEAIYNWMMDHLVIVRTSTLDQFFGGTY